MSRHSATSSVPTRNAGCSDRTMAARAGAMFFIETPIRALSIWRWIRAIRASYLQPSGRPAGTSGTSRAEGREAGSSVPPTAARAGRDFALSGSADRSARQARRYGVARPLGTGLGAGGDGGGEGRALPIGGLRRELGADFVPSRSDAPALVLHACLRRSVSVAETVYVANLQLWKSTDGGASFTEIQTPHGDNHDLWIDPADPNRMIEGNDGGACVSCNGGQTWSSIYNQPTAQFYRIDTDSQYPIASTPHSRTTPRFPCPVLPPGCHHPRGLHLSWHWRKRLCRGASRRSEHRLLRRDRLQSRRRWGAAALRPSHRANPAGECLARGIARNRTQGHAIPLCLDVSDRLFAARQRDTVCGRQPCVPQPRRGHELGEKFRRISV